MKLFSLIVASLISLSVLAGGPGKGTTVIRGKVLDSNMESLAGVKVKVGTGEYSTYTDFEGNFVLTLPAEYSEATFSFEMVSYEPVTTHVDQADGSEFVVTLKER